MKRASWYVYCIAGVLTVTILCSGCSYSDAAIQEISSSQAKSESDLFLANNSRTISSSSLASSSGSPSASSMGETSSFFSKSDEILPEQVVNYMKESLKGSKLLTINPEGKVVKTVSYPGQCLSNAQISPNGRYMLCETDAESNDGTTLCGYTVIDLQTGKQYPFSKQTTYLDHSILSDSMIGYAWGSPTFLEKGDSPIQLFDMQYRLLNISINFDFGDEITLASGDKYYEHYINGICYDSKKEVFYITFARDTSHIGLSSGVIPDLFSETRLGIAVFDKDGKLLDKRMLPKEYMAPYSYNTLSLLNTGPAVLPDGWLVVRAMIEENDCPLLLVNPSDWTIKRLSYSGSGGDTGVTGMVHATLKETSTTENTYKVLMDINGGNITAALKLPKSIQEAGYTNKFMPTGAAWKNGKGYLTTYNGVGSNKDICGLFSWDGNRTKLIHLFPAYFINTLGIDEDGNCLVLLYGATPQMKESYFVY